MGGNLWTSSGNFFMKINPNILQWLDLVDSNEAGNYQQSKSVASHFVKKCVTPAGKRKVKDILAKPLNNLDIIHMRMYFMKKLAKSDKFLASSGQNLRLVSNIKHCIRSLELQHLNNDSWVTLIRQIPVFIQILTELNEWNNKEKNYIKNNCEDPFLISSLERKD